MQPHYRVFSDTDSRECSHCGEPAHCELEGAGPVCFACVEAIEASGRANIGEAWCPIRGCWGEPVADFQPCVAHASALVAGLIAVATMHDSEMEG